jgi:hypothetical protein
VTLNRIAEGINEPSSPVAAAVSRRGSSDNHPRRLFHDAALSVQRLLEIEDGDRLRAALSSLGTTTLRGLKRLGSFSAEIIAKRQRVE